MKKEKLDMPAFPVSTIDNYTQYRMGLRDYIAVAALQALLTRGNWDTDSQGHYSEVAYKYADQMIKERER